MPSPGDNVDDVNVNNLMVLRQKVLELRAAFRRGEADLTTLYAAIDQYIDELLALPSRSPMARRREAGAPGGADPCPGPGGTT